MILCQLEEVLQAQAYILFYKRISVKQERLPPLISSDSESSDSLPYSVQSEDSFKYSLMSEDTVKYSLNSEDTVQLDGSSVTQSRSSPSVLSKRGERRLSETSAKRGSPVCQNITQTNDDSVTNYKRTDTLVLENSTDMTDSVSEHSSIQGTSNSLETKSDNSSSLNSKHPVTRSQTGSLKRSLDNDVYVYSEYMYAKKPRRKSVDSEKVSKNGQNQNNNTVVTPLKLVKEENGPTSSEMRPENNFLTKTEVKKHKVYDAEHIIEELKKPHLLKRRKSTFW